MTDPFRGMRLNMSTLGKRRLGGQRYQYMKDMAIAERFSRGGGRNNPERLRYVKERLRRADEEARRRGTYMTPGQREYLAETLGGEWNENRATEIERQAANEHLAPIGQAAQQRFRGSNVTGNAASLMENSAEKMGEGLMKAAGSLEKMGQALQEAIAQL